MLPSCYQIPTFLLVSYFFLWERWKADISLQAAHADKYPRSSQEFPFILSPRQHCQGRWQTSHLEKPEGHSSSRRRWAVNIFFLPPWSSGADCPRRHVNRGFLSLVARVSLHRSEGGVRWICSPRWKILKWSVSDLPWQENPSKAFSLSGSVKRFAALSRGLYEFARHIFLR